MHTVIRLSVRLSVVALTGAATLLPMTAASAKGADAVTLGFTVHWSDGHTERWSDYQSDYWRLDEWNEDYAGQSQWIIDSGDFPCAKPAS